MNTVPLFALKLTVQIDYILQVNCSLWIELVLRLKHMHKKSFYQTYDFVLQWVVPTSWLFLQLVSAGPVSI